MNTPEETTPIQSINANDAPKIIGAIQSSGHIIAAAQEENATEPLLFPLSKEKEYTSDFFSHMERLPWILFISAREAPELHQFLRHRMTIRRADGSTFLFRLSPLALGALLKTLTRQRAAQFFGPVKGVFWPVIDKRNRAVWNFCSLLPSTATESAPEETEALSDWEMTDKEWADFQRHCAQDRLVQDTSVNPMFADWMRRLGEDLKKKETPPPNLADATARSQALFRHALGAISLPVPWERRLLTGGDRANLAACPDGFALPPEIGSNADSRKEAPECPPPGKPASAADILNCRHERFLYGLNRLSHPLFWSDRLWKKSAKESIRACLDGFALPVLEQPLETPPAGRVGLMCLLHFRGGHLAKIQEGVCECIREYARILGDAARCALTPAGRVVLAGTRRLALPDKARIGTMQERGKREFFFLVSSSATRDDYERQPPASLLQARLYLNEMPPPRAGKKTAPALPPVPLDRQISTFAAFFPPSLFLLDAQPLSFVALLLRWCERLRPVSGAAGWGIASVCDPAQAKIMTPLLLPHLRRFPGLGMLPVPGSGPAEPAVSVNWLTMLDEELTARIGGPERLAALGGDFPTTAYPGGHMIQAGPRPELDDGSRGEMPRCYGKVQELLGPLAPPQLP